MYRYLVFSALALASTAASADTSVCTNIAAVPYVISTPGSYCMNQNLTMPAGGEGSVYAIPIQANDVTHDSNSHTLSGPAPIMPPADPQNVSGIILEGSARSVVRNCTISGFQNAIRIGVSIDTTPRPRDAIIEDNRIIGSMFGISGTGEGVNRIRRNSLMNVVGGGILIVAYDGIMHVTDNFVSATGNTTSVDGTAANFGTAGAVGPGGANAWVFAEDNNFAETVGPQGEGPAAAVVIAANAKVSFEGNIVSAPSTPANQGFVTEGVYADPTAQFNCQGNAIVGYGTEANNPGCAAANNRIY